MQAPSQGIGTLIVMLGGIMMRVSGLELQPCVYHFVQCLRVSKNWDLSTQDSRLRINR